MGSIKTKLVLYKEIFHAVREMIQSKKFVLVTTDMENNQEHYNLNLFWQGLNDEGVEVALFESHKAVKGANDTLKTAKEILSNQE